MFLLLLVQFHSEQTVQQGFLWSQNVYDDCSSSGNIALLV